MEGREAGRVKVEAEAEELTVVDLAGDTAGLEPNRVWLVVERASGAGATGQPALQRVEVVLKPDGWQEAAGQAREPLGAEEPGGREQEVDRGLEWGRGRERLGRMSAADLEVEREEPDSGAEAGAARAAVEAELDLAEGFPAAGWEAVDLGTSLPTNKLWGFYGR